MNPTAANGAHGGIQVKYDEKGLGRCTLGTHRIGKSLRRAAILPLPKAQCQWVIILGQQM